jgi:integrase
MHLGRPRKHDLTLPKGMSCERGTFFFRGPDRKRINLGQDIIKAIDSYKGLVGQQGRVRTLHDVIERYRLDVLPLKRSAATRENEARSLARLDRIFGHFLPDNITAPMCYEYMDRRLKKDGTPAPVSGRHEITLLGHVLSKSIRWGAGIANVVRTLDRMPKSKRTRYVTDEEFMACRALANPRMQVAMDLARNIGQRRGDLLKLKLEDCTDAGIVIRQGKTGAGIVIKWTPTLRKIIRNAKGLSPDIPRDFVLRSRSGEPYSSFGFSAIWQRLMVKYVGRGGVRFTFHDLRAKAASDMETVEDAQALLGHSSPETTKRVYKRNLTVARPVK